MQTNIFALWRDGACVGADLKIFLPKPKCSYPEAERICSGCLVREECLTWALDVPNFDREMGFVGGMSQKQRRAERALRKAD
jgi:WhiB family transcriptional regulator, redox-sensing transcriptional regulator